MNRLQAAVRHRAVGIGAGQQHEDVGAGGERAPRLDPVDDVARRAVDPVCGGGGDLQPGDVTAVVGLGDGDGHHHLGRGQLGQPLLLLLLGAALHQRPGEDLGSCDQRAADAEAGPAQLLGGDDHAEVLAVAALVVAAVLGRHRQPEGADLGEAADDVLRDVAVAAVDVLRLGGDDVVGEGAERVLHQLHVVVEVAGARRLGQRREVVGIAVRLEERMSVAQRRRVHAPHLLAAGQPGDQVVDHVGREGAGDRRLGVALGAVVEQGAGGGGRRSSVGEVVGEHLAGVGTAGVVEVADGGGDDLVSQTHGVGGSGQIRGRGHALRRYRPVRPPPESPSAPTLAG